MLLNQIWVRVSTTRSTSTAGFSADRAAIIVRSFIWFSEVARSAAGMVPGAAPRSRSAVINDAVWSIHFCMYPDHIVRNSELVASASVAARASAGWEWNATKNALITLRHTRRVDGGKG